MQILAGIGRFAGTFAVVLVTLDGHVLDTTTGQPLAHVRVGTGGARTVTDARGRFVLRGVHSGTVRLTLESADVPTQYRTVHLGGGSAHRDLRACSTTLDYSCMPAGSSAPGSSGGAG